MMIVAGYVITFAYVFFLIFVLGSVIRKRTNIETSRKTIHTMLFMVWVFIDLFFKNSIHQVILPVAFLILNALSYKFKIYKSVEREDQNHLGTVYFAIAITAVMAAAYWRPELYLPTGVAAFCLTVGDGFAALIGYNFRSKKVREREGKSILGMGACFAASCAAVTAFRLIWWPRLGAGDILLIAAAAAILELTGSGLDNFTITFGTFGLSWLLTAADDPAVSLGVMWAVLVFAVVFLSRAIDYRGSLLAMGVVFAFRFCGGRVGLAYLLGTYFTIFAIGLARRRVLPSHRAGPGRGALQILINGGLGTLSVILFGLTGERWLFALTLTAIGGCFIDSVSSDVGRMAKRQPYDPLRRTRVERGLSGGMTVLGTVSAAVFSLLIAAFAGFAARMSVGAALLIGGLSFSQTLADTAMGSLLQVKYRCPVCGADTEKREHCGEATVYRSGVRWIGNNAVNLLSSLLVTLLAAILLRACL